MTVKQLPFLKDVRDRIRRGVRAVVEAIKFTPGLLCRTMTLDRDCGPPQIVNSGVLLQMGVMDPARVTHQALQKAEAIASMVWAIACIPCQRTSAQTGARDWYARGCHAGALMRCQQ